jgi:hypothetical protein
MQWDKSADGKIAVCPLVSFGITIVAHTVCAVRLEFARTPDQLRERDYDGVQLVLTHAQITALTKALSDAAQHIVSARPAGKPN